MGCSCSEGFDRDAGRCCSCASGRRRAYRMWLSYSRERDGEEEKARIRREAEAGPPCEKVTKKVPKFRWIWP